MSIQGIVSLSKKFPQSLSISRFFPEMREWKRLLHQKGCRQLGGSLWGY